MELLMHISTVNKIHYKLLDKLRKGVMIEFCSRDAESE